MRRLGLEDENEPWVEVFDETATGSGAMCGAASSGPPYVDVEYIY